MFRAADIDDLYLIKGTESVVEQSSFASMVAIPSSKKQTPIKCNLKLTIALLLFCVATIPLFAIKHLQLDEDNVLHLEHSGHIKNQQSLRAAAAGNNIQRQSNIQQVSCPQYLSDTTIYNPNTELTRDETKRLTITEPQFYISLHSQFYDKMRYVHIMKQESPSLCWLCAVVCSI